MNKPKRATAGTAWGRRIVKGGLVLGLVLSACWAQAQTAIQSVTGGIQSGAEVIRINLSEPLKATPSSFSVQSQLLHDQGSDPLMSRHRFRA